MVTVSKPSPNCKIDILKRSKALYYEQGRIVLSQNTKQFNQSPKKYTYTIYDELGRVIELGAIADKLNLVKSTTKVVKKLV